jgi:hypothetical protein
MTEGHHSWCNSKVRAEIASCCQPDAVALERLIAEKVWGQGYASGWSNAMRIMSDEPNAPKTENPYRAEDEDG